MGITLLKLGKPSHQPYREYIHYQNLGLTISFYRGTDQMAEIDLDQRREK